MPRKSSKGANIVLDCCNMLKSQRISNSSRIHEFFSPNPHKSNPPWGLGRAFGKPRPETQGTLNHPHSFSFAKCSQHHVPKHSASNTVLHGGPVEHGSKGGTHSHVAPPTRFSHTLSLPPLPTLVYTHTPTLPHRSMNTVVCAGLGNGGCWFVGVAPGGLA